MLDSHWSWEVKKLEKQSQQCRRSWHRISHGFPSLSFSITVLGSSWTPHRGISEWEQQVKPEELLWGEAAARKQSPEGVSVMGQQGVGRCNSFSSCQRWWAPVSP